MGKKEEALWDYNFKAILLLLLVQIINSSKTESRSSAG
jgi:hypothetical protein